MSTFKRFEKPILIGLAVFLLVIFSVTGPMAEALARIFGGGPVQMATIEFGGSRDEIGQEEYRQSWELLSVQQRLPFLGGLIQGRPGTEDIIAFAVMRRLADQYEVAIADLEMRDYLTQVLAQYKIDYETLYKNSLGYPTALSFEKVLREVLRITKVQEVLSWAAAPTTEEVLEWWADRYKEYTMEYVVWNPGDFDAAAEAEVPEEEALQEFFDEGLNQVQIRELEVEEKVPFEVLVLSADALLSPAVQEWAGVEEPTPEALKGFYDFHRAQRYLRPLPEEGVEVDPNQSPYLTMEELGDRLVQDFKLNSAAMALLPRLPGVEDVGEFAGQMGVEYQAFEEAVMRSELKDLPRIGTARLDDMFRSLPNQWMSPPVLVEDLAVLLRPGEVVERALPPLEEVREEVLGHWRAQRRDELVLEAAEKFLEELPRPEGYIEGDPVTLDAEAFAAAARAAGLDVLTMDWVSGLSRPSHDPKWPKDEKVLPWVRLMIGRDLEETLEEQAVGPLQHPTEKAVVVGRIGGMRKADPAGIWPGELQQARSLARNDAYRKFIDEQLSYEGLSRAYNIQLVLPEVEEEEEEPAPPQGK